MTSDWTKATHEEREAEQLRRLQQARQQGPRALRPMRPGLGQPRPMAPRATHVTEFVAEQVFDRVDRSCNYCGLPHPTRMCPEVKR